MKWPERNFQHPSNPRNSELRDYVARLEAHVRWLEMLMDVQCHLLQAENDAFRKYFATQPLIGGKKTDD